MIVYWLVYEGFGKGQVSVLNPVFASFTGLVAIISIVFFREQVSVSRFVAIAVIFCGVMMISMDLTALRSGKIKLDHVPGLKEIGLAALLAAIWTLSWDKFVGGQDSLSVTLFMYGFMTVAAYLLARVKVVKLSLVKSDLWKFLVLIGLGEVIAYLGITWGYASTSLTSVVAVISGAFSLPTIILARVFLKEKVVAVQTVGSLVIIAGIIILSLS